VVDFDFALSSLISETLKTNVKNGGQECPLYTGKEEPQKRRPMIGSARNAIGVES